MAKAPVRDTEAGSPREDWHPLFSAGLLGVAVLGILLLGVWLRSPEEAPGRDITQRRQPVSASVAAVPPAPLELSPEFRPESDPAGADFDEQMAMPQQPAAGSSLALRARADLERLREVGREEWTLQVAVACDTANAQRWVDDWEASSSAYLLPATVEGRPCFRLCWGRFASRAQAATSSLPTPLESASPQPRAIAELVR